MSSHTWAGAVLTALIVAGCGSSDDAGEASSGTSASAGGSAGATGMGASGNAPGGSAGHGGALGPGGGGKAGAAQAGAAGAGGGGATGLGGQAGNGGGQAGASGKASAGGNAGSSGNTQAAGMGGSNGGTSSGAGGGAGGENAAGQGGAGGDSGASGTGGASAGSPGCSAPADYDALVLCDDPVAYWDMTASAADETDRTGHGHSGTYLGGAPVPAALPNGDEGAAFDGKSQYLTVDSSAAFSIPTTHSLTWEAWIRPDTLQFPHGSDDGYVDWMGKCEQYSPTCEWEARMYDTTNPQDRCNRLSAYVFNPNAGLGSAADWQPECGLLQAGDWYHVVGEYTTDDQPSDCTDAGTYPGSIDIWVNGVKWDHASHGQTGCMSQYKVVPAAHDSALTIGTMASDTFFQGAIGKVAIYDHLLTAAQIGAHYQKMTSKTPSGSCADTCSF